MGDLIRDEMKRDSPLGEEMRSFVKKGQLVPDEVVAKFVDTALFDSPDTDAGWMLDGYPRNMEQAAFLDALLEKRGRGLQFVLELGLREDVLIQKAEGRRGCENCGRGYNLANIIDESAGIYMPPLAPKVDGKCDDCGGALFRREDDNAETIKARLKLYHDKTAPILDHYKSQPGLVYRYLDVSKGKAATTPLLLDLLAKEFPK
eukprot:CAMPEP_0205825344 /NCGR_PEP_ID=MMETSP0206-20130828/24833_1 /ASSEMBLY_ACC=CAM_ASM_000279 /TAXON_ID=36767 /ORGANISM="Euplotes focardii, Strain TN1" /LENGTH=203 /DNA_ID=CAMNT_0053124301 /DNA_START=186 /DNA_END=797 /DNA_ORIENTATION=+